MCYETPLRFKVNPSENDKETPQLLKLYIVQKKQREKESNFTSLDKDAA